MDNTQRNRRRKLRRVTKGALVKLYKKPKHKKHAKLWRTCQGPYKVLEIADNGANVTPQHGAAPPMIGVYGNAFPLMDDKYEGANANIHQLREDITPENYLHFARHWAEIGADIIGGCCGVAPDHISLLAKALKDPPPINAPEFG